MDVKSGNFLIDENDSVAISDFGVDTIQERHTVQRMEYDVQFIRDNYYKKRNISWGTINRSKFDDMEIHISAQRYKVLDVEILII